MVLLLIFFPIAVISSGKKNWHGESPSRTMNMWDLILACRLLGVSPDYFSTLFLPQIEVLSPINGDFRYMVSNVNDAGLQPEEDAVVGLHLFARQKSELTSRYCKIVGFWGFVTWFYCMCLYYWIPEVDFFICG